MKLFVFDVDGTLVTYSQVLRKSTIKTLNHLLDEGHAIAIASGRSFPGIHQYLAKLHDGKKFAICANGSTLMDFEHNIIYELTVPYKTLLDLRNVFKEDVEQGLSIYGYYKDEIIYFNYDKWVRNEKNSNSMKAHTYKKYNLNENDQLYKIMIASNPEHNMNLVLPDEIYENYHVVRSSPVFLEIVNKQCDKSYGVEILRKYLNIEVEDVYTFGDNGNDFEMVKNYTGVAVDNAIEEVKKVAKYRTKSVKEDGVSFAINNILKI